MSKQTVRVSPAQVQAAKLKVKRAAGTGVGVAPAVTAIANAVRSSELASQKAS